MTGFARCVGLAPPRLEPQKGIWFGWIIEVVFTGGESRSPLYFSGEIQPGRHGCTTRKIEQADHYEREREALYVLRYLKPRELGQWRIQMHCETVLKVDGTWIAESAL